MLHLCHLPQQTCVYVAKLGQTALRPCSLFLNPSFVQQTPDGKAKGQYWKQHFGAVRELQVDSRFLTAN